MVSPVLTDESVCPAGVQRGRQRALLHRRQPGGPEELDDLHQVRPQRAGAEPRGGADRQQHLLQGCGGQSSCTAPYHGHNHYYLHYTLLYKYTRV